MGLDMYLEKAKRIGNVTPRQLNAVNEYFDYLGRGEKYKDCTMKKWCGIDISEVDMSLVAEYSKERITRYYSWDDEKKYGHKSIIDMVGDWRKANHIHNWFVQNVQDGNDNCELYEVTKEKLEELLKVCKTVLNSSTLVNGKIVNGQKIVDGTWVDIYEDGEYIADHSVAEELLPTASGFFFGSTEYDQWYIADVRHTIEIIENVLETTNFEHEIVMYCSSW